MPRPLVSVVVASYNGERFLADALASIFAQDYDPFEVVFVDDGSVDRTATVAQTHRLLYLRQAHGGLAAARNCGIAAATGDLVTFVDDDDVLPVYRLRVQADYLSDHPDVDCVLGRQQWIGEPTDAPRDPVFGDPGGIPLAAAMVRRRTLLAIGGFDGSFAYAEDRDLLIRLRE